MPKNKAQKNLGFTLVELLVVISIIGILSSLAIVSLNSARAKARDALRKGDMAQMRTAINLYYDDNGKYPICGNWDSEAADFGATAEAGSICYNGILDTALTGGSRPFLASMPKDPKNSENKKEISQTYIYRYVSQNDGNQYALVYMIEDNTDLQVIRGW